MKRNAFRSGGPVRACPGCMFTLAAGILLASLAFFVAGRHSDRRAGHVLARALQTSYQHGGESID